MILPERRMSGGAAPCAIIRRVSTAQFYLCYVLDGGTSAHRKTSLEDTGIGIPKAI